MCGGSRPRIRAAFAHFRPVNTGHLQFSSLGERVLNPSSIVVEAPVCPPSSQ